MKVAIIGTQGVPAQYGGFETLAENLLKCKSPEVEYTVFCSSKDYPQKLKTYLGAKLIYIPVFRSNGIQSIPYDVLSLIRAVRGFDVIVVLGTSGCVCLPVFKLLCRKRLIINIDGLEHRREKWGGFARKFLKFSETMAIHFANSIVVDNEGIHEYVKEHYQRDGVLIAYGADHVLSCNISEDEQMRLVDSYFLKSQEYAFVLCRIEPENKCHVILETFAKNGHKLVFFGNWRASKYGIILHRKYNSCPNIRLLDANYDQTTLHVLRSNCQVYIHGHSAGGTNPSLVEAMLHGIPVIAFDCVYNRKTTDNKAIYFTDADSLQLAVETGEEKLARNKRDMFLIAEERYRWKTIVKQYEQLYYSQLNNN